MLSLLVTSCHPKMVPSGKSDVHYEESSDKTIYSVEPFGKLQIGGKWMEGKFNPSTHQQYFYHKDTATLVVTIDACKNSPYYKKGVEGYDFVKKYFNLESQYQSQLMDQKVEQLSENAQDRCIIWRAHIDGIDQYFLCGVRDCTCNECSYRLINLKSRKHTEAKATAYLKEIFMSEK
ncbi:MAG: hypothetical protein KF744_09775 [Taibaiella sp.]|nr:hypothetical protein [Taibaiella sp.]